MEDLRFVLTNSFYPLFFALGFLVLGFLYGYFHWARWVREIQTLKAEVDGLERGSDPITLGAAAEHPPASDVSLADKLNDLELGKTASVESDKDEFRFKDISFD